MRKPIVPKPEFATGEEQVSTEDFLADYADKSELIHHIMVIYGHWQQRRIYEDQPRKDRDALNKNKRRKRNALNAMIKSIDELQNDPDLQTLGKIVERTFQERIRSKNHNVELLVSLQDLKQTLVGQLRIQNWKRGSQVRSYLDDITKFYLLYLYANGITPTIWRDDPSNRLSETLSGLRLLLEEHAPEFSKRIVDNSLYESFRAVLKQWKDQA